MPNSFHLLPIDVICNLTGLDADKVASFRPPWLNGHVKQFHHFPDGTPPLAVVLLSVAVTESGCWEWRRSSRHSSGGYGIVNLEGRMQRTHVIVYECVRGRVGTSLVCHTCDNPPCCNPDHLFLGDHEINAQDASGKGRLHRMHPEIVRGENNGHATLTEADVRFIHDSDDKLRSLADTYHVSPSHIQRIKTEQAWRHLWM